MGRDNSENFAPAGTVVTCRECKHSSNVDDWPDCEPYCEDCGNHAGIECPECGEQYDHVWDSDALYKGPEKTNGLGFYD